MRPLQRLLVRVHRRLLIHRRPLAALCAAAAVALALTTLRPPAPEVVLLWTATRDLPSGTVLAPEDLHRTAFLPASVPATAARADASLVGHTLAAPLEAGEAASTADLLGDGMLRHHPGQVGVPVRIPDGDVVELLQVGDRVDVVASDPQGRREARHLLTDAPVLAVPVASETAAAPGSGGRLLVLGVPKDSAAQVAEAATTLYLTVIWTR